MSRPSTFHASTNSANNGAQTNTSDNNASSSSAEKTYFEVQRMGLMREIGVSMESVLQNINKLNRSLEGIISVGNEFSSVEALWSHFENVMAPKDDDAAAASGTGAEGGEVDEQGGGEGVGMR